MLSRFLCYFFRDALHTFILINECIYKNKKCICVSSDQYVKRRRTALWCSVSLFGLSVLALVIGLLSATQTDNVAVSGYYPGIIVSDVPFTPQNMTITLTYMLVYTLLNITKVWKQNEFSWEHQMEHFKMKLTYFSHSKCWHVCVNSWVLEHS